MIPECCICYECLGHKGGPVTLPCGKAVVVESVNIHSLPRISLPLVVDGKYGLHRDFLFLSPNFCDVLQGTMGAYSA